MDFADILEQWEAQTQRPYGKKRITADKKKNRSAAFQKENQKTLSPLELWLRRYGVYDKDAACEKEEPPIAVRLAERQRLRAMRPQAEIDLHGMTVEEASEKLQYFFSSAVRQQYRKVLIIHGKGNHSQGEPVLSRFVQHFLEDHPHAGERGHPKAKDGGSGSTWVILK